MDREVFLEHLLRAGQLCRELTTQFVVDSLPSTYAFRVLLNCSYDRKPLRDDEIVFPDDVRKRGKRVGRAKNGRSRIGPRCIASCVGQA